VRVAALAVAGRHGRRVRAVDPLGVAEIRAPATGRILEHASVVERALGGVVVGILPDRAEGVEAAAGRRTRRGIDGRAVLGIAGHVEDLLVRLSAGIDPALDDLYALEERPGRGQRA